MECVNRDFATLALHIFDLFSNAIKCEISLLTSNLTMLLELVYKFKFNFNPNSNPEVLEDLNCSQVLELCTQD